MEEDEDDLYTSQSVTDQKSTTTPHHAEPGPSHDAAMADTDSEEEDEDDEDDDDSDIEIVTEAKEDRKDSSAQARRLEAKPEKSAAIRITEAPASSSKAPQSPPPKKESTSKEVASSGRSGSDYPAVRTSTVDVNAEPTLDATGKSILKTDMDADFGEGDKPWRLPGADQNDFFNYGFDEFTWSSYCLKQESLRKEAKDQEKQLDDMQKFFNMPNMGAGGGGMGGGGEFPGDMMGMMQQMMAAGMDPSNQMDVGNFMQMGGGGGGGGGMGGGGGGNFGNFGGGGGGHGGGGGGRRHGRGRY